MRLVIVGAGGHGREVLDVVEALNERGAGIEVVGFLAQSCGEPEALARRRVAIVGDETVLATLQCGFTLAIGDPSARHAVADRLGAAGEAVTLVHPETRVDASAELGPGSMVPAGAIVESGAVLGPHTHLNVNASVGSGARLESFATLSPGSVIGEAVVLGEDVLVGAGAHVAPGVRVGDGAVVGAGAEITQDVAPGATVTGRPAST